MQNSRRSSGGKDRPNRGSGPGRAQPNRGGSNAGGSSGGQGNRRDRPGQNRPSGKGKASPAVPAPSQPRSTLIDAPIKFVPDKLQQGQHHQPELIKVTKRKYGIVFFDTLAAAKNDLPRLQEMARGFDQLNIVIRAEASMDDPELAAIGKVFAGAAWALIHDRRVTDGWYNEAH